MDVAQMILDFLAKVAWPLLALWGIIKFRKEIGEALSGLGAKSVSVNMGALGVTAERLVEKGGVGGLGGLLAGVDHASRTPTTNSQTPDTKKTAARGNDVGAGSEPPDGDTSETYSESQDIQEPDSQANQEMHQDVPNIPNAALFSHQLKSGHPQFTTVPISNQVDYARSEVFFWLSLALGKYRNLDKVRESKIVTSSEYRAVINLAHSKKIINDAMKDDAYELDRLINEEIPHIYEKMSKAGQAAGRNLLGGHPGVDDLLSRVGSITAHTRSYYKLPKNPEWPPNIATHTQSED